MNQYIQIIGGLYRGKKIPVADVDGLRPTPNRVRETLFNWLMHDIKGARCLDAFAGSGALGLEAHSRGASQVTFIEQAPTAHVQLKKVISEFNSPKLNLIKADARSYLQTCTEQFDIIFLDPPYSQNLILPCLQDICQNNILSAEGLVYFESPTKLEIDAQNWQNFKLKQAGQVIFGLIKKA